MISDGVCFVMFYVSVLTKKKTSWFTQWRTMESTHFSEHRRSSHRWGHQVQLLRTCQNLSKPQTASELISRFICEATQRYSMCIFLTAEMRLCLIPSWTGGSSRFMPCTSSSSARWASCEASLQHYISVHRSEGSRSPEQVLPSMRITLQNVDVCCILYICMCQTNQILIQ